MDAQALQAIQSKLLRQRQEMNQEAPVDLLVDWPPPYGVKAHSTAAQAAEAVTMLQQRSRRSGHRPRVVERSPAVDREQHRPLDLLAYRQQMAAITQRINDLSLAQEQAIANMQRVQQQLVASASAPPPIHFDQALTAWASLNAHGEVVLSHRPVPPQPHQEAYTLAHHLRQAYGVPGQRPHLQGRPSPGHPRPRRLWPRLRRLGRWIREGLSAWSPLQTQTIEPSPPPTATEAMGWAGAGVAGRLALHGLLTVLPSLGVVAVVACLASLALLLYRAILPPAPDVNLISRVALALGGLFIGGYLL